MKKGICLVLTTAIISGFSVFINKFAVMNFNAQVFTTLKNAIVGLYFIALLIALKDFQLIKKIKGREWLKLMLIGLIGGSLPFLLFFQGLSQTTAAKGGFIHKTMFVYVAIFSLLLLKEKFNKQLFIGLISLITANILFLKIKPQPLQVGDLLILLATFLWALEIILSKKMLKDLPGRIVAAARMCFGAIFMFGYLAFSHQLSFTIASGNQWFWLIATSTILFAYNFTFYAGLKHISATVAASILALGAPITLILNIIFLGQGFSQKEIIGFVLIVISLLMISQLNLKKYKKLNITNARS